MKKLILVSLMPFLLYGCMMSSPMPGPGYSPSDIIRNIESRNGKWLVMRGKIGSNTQQVIGIKVISVNTLILLKGEYYLFRSKTTPIVISKDSVGMDMENSVISAPLLYPAGKKLVDSKNQPDYLYGYFINLDKIFLENGWCNFICIDDTFDGLLFNRQGQEHIELNYRLAEEFCLFNIIYECSSYSLLKKYGEDTFNKKINDPAIKSNTSK